MPKSILTIVLFSITIFLFVACTIDPGTYTLTINTTPAGIGTILKSPDQTSYSADTVVTLTANSNNQYTFDHWEGSLTGGSNPALVTMDSVKNITAVFVQRKWTIMVYMDGDNNLETDAIKDLNEMESADLTGTGVDIIVLFDRISGFDTTNNNWTNTRLYNVNYDPIVNNNNIVSMRLASAELGLTLDGNEELNLGDPATVSNFISFCKTNYSAENYCFIFWNHGGGWRSTTAPVATRQVCEDDTSDDRLYTQEIHTGLNGSDLAIVGFDLCYGAMIEMMYEIRNDAAYMIASEEVEPLAGWDYTQLFNNFKATTLTPLDFIISTMAAFTTSYSTVSGTTLSAVDLTQIDTVMNTFNAFALALYDEITTSTIRTEILGIISDDVENYYSFGGDWNIDLWDLADQIETSSVYANIITEVADLKSAVKNAVVAEWHNSLENPGSKGIAVHFCLDDEDSGLNPIVDPDYWKNHPSLPYPPPSFLAVSDWVPEYLSGPGLLYKLFIQTTF